MAISDILGPNARFARVMYERAIDDLKIRRTLNPAVRKTILSRTFRPHSIRNFLSEQTFAFAVNYLKGVITPVPNKKVLLVDDEVAVRNLYQLSLEREGMLVVSAAGKTEALQSIRNSTFDVAVIDLHLLDGDGLELVREIRARNGKMKVLAMSGYTFDPELLDDLGARQIQVYRKYEPLSRLVALLNGE